MHALVSWRCNELAGAPEATLQSGPRTYVVYGLAATAACIVRNSRHSSNALHNPHLPAKVVLTVCWLFLAHLARLECNDSFLRPNFLVTHVYSSSMDANMYIQSTYTWYQGRRGVLSYAIPQVRSFSSAYLHMYLIYIHGQYAANSRPFCLMPAWSTIIS